MGVLSRNARVVEEPTRDYSEDPASDCPIDDAFLKAIRRDSIAVQMERIEVNDDEEHDDNSHLKDYLVPDHSFHIEPSKSEDAIEKNEACDQKTDEDESSDEEEQDEQDEVAPTKKCCTKGILKKDDVASVKSTQEAASSRKHPKREVHWGSVTLRDYDIILGDHPCCSYGPPITISWDYLQYESIDVDEYEFHHSPRRTLREMCLNFYMRKYLLLKAGFSEEDMKLAKKEASRTKLQRSITREVVSHYSPLVKVETAVESACRKFKRLIKDDHWKQQKSLYV